MRASRPRVPPPMVKIIAVVILLGMVVGLAHAIETSARPSTGRQGQEVHGGHAH